MNELKTVESGIVPVYETSSGEKVVYGTELHEVLEVKSNYREWIQRRFRDVDAVKNDDYEAVVISTASGQGKNEHIIKLDTAKEIAMLERNSKGKQVRRYFIEIEKRYKAAQEIIHRESEKNWKILSDIMKDYMNNQTQKENNQNILLQTLTERIEALEDRDKRNVRENTNPYSLADSIVKEERLRELNKLVSHISEVYKISRNRNLHYLYKEVEESTGVSLNSYLSVYKFENSNSDACILEVIAANERLFLKALELCNDAIQRKTIYG